MAAVDPDAQSTVRSVDIEAIIRDYAKEKIALLFRKDRKMKKLLRKGKIIPDILWDSVIIQHEPTVYSPEVPKPNSAFGKPKTNVLFSTTFTNKTNQGQKCIFMAQRTTKTTTQIEVQKGYRSQQSAGITLKTPGELLEANVGFEREVSLSNNISKTEEKELQWSVNNEIMVDQGHKANASLVVTEEEYEGRFTSVTYFSGSIFVRFNNISDNNSQVAVADYDIYNIFDWAIREEKIPNDGIIRTEDKPIHRVKCTAKGVCKFQYGVKQDVEVIQTILGDKELEHPKGYV